MGTDYIYKSHSDPYLPWVLWSEECWLYGACMCHVANCHILHQSSSLLLCMCHVEDQIMSDRISRMCNGRQCCVLMCIVTTRYMLVSFPDPIMHARGKSGDIGAVSWFCKLSNHVIICIGLYWSTCGHVMVRKTKKTLQCPQTLFLACVVGSGNETRYMYAVRPIMFAICSRKWYVVDN